MKPINWQNCADELERWKQNPSEYAIDGEVEPLSFQAYRSGAHLIQLFIDIGMLLPSSMVCDNDGGFLLEWQDGNEHYELNIDEDGMPWRRQWTDRKG